jgi:[protein-PII] uridylyltransferase
VSREEREEFEKLVTRVLTGETVDYAALIAREPAARTPYQSYEGDRIPTQISFDNEASENRTAIEVETEDRVGLLHAITQALAELELNITAAKIVTEKGAAIDTFYVNETDGGKVLDQGRQEFIERKLRDAIARLG